MSNPFTFPHCVTGCVVTIVCGLGLTACPSGKFVRPQDPSYADTVGGSTAPVVEGYTEPLVVDWAPEHRGDLEVAMKEGIAVVSYTRGGMQLLKNCRVEGTYGFIGTTLKEQVVSLADENEIHANLPLSGIGIAGKIGGELQQGATLDVAMAMIGKRKTTVRELSRDALDSACKGATHFVQGATIGAFAMKTVAKGHAGTTDEIFGIGAGASTSSDKQVMNKDGDLDACRKADPDGSEPPAQCGAVLRLELNQITNESAKTLPSSVKIAAIANPCPAGLVMSDGKCTASDQHRSHQCKVGDVQDCTMQCERGQVESCVNLGYALHMGQGTAKNTELAKRHYLKACDLGSALACHNLGVLLSDGDGVAQDLARAAVLFDKACQLGEARGCNSLGAAYYTGSGVPADVPKAVALFVRACDGGEALACSNLGSMQIAGDFQPASPSFAAVMFKRACQGKELAGCCGLGNVLEQGIGVDVDLPRAATFYEGACKFGYPLGCYSLATLTAVGKGVPQNAKRAEELFAQACKASEVLSCATLRVVYHQPVQVDAQQVNLYRATLDNACAAGQANDCASVGILLSAIQDPAAKDTLNRACSLGDKWGCHVAQVK